MDHFFEFIEKTNKAQSKEQIFELFQSQMALLGFDKVLYTLATDHDSIGQKAGHGIMRNYPDDWMKFYTEKNYVEIDPVIKNAAISNQPFVWNKMHESMPFLREQRRLLKEAEEAGLYCGVGLGIHGNGNEFAALGFASSEQKLDLGRNTLSMVNAVANQFHFAYCEMQKRHCKTQKPRVNINLTRMELVILNWLALGKTNNEIACITSISPTTVDYHLRQIFRKLEANSKQLAVVKGIKYGLINP